MSQFCKSFSIFEIETLTELTILEFMRKVLSYGSMYTMNKFLGWVYERILESCWHNIIIVMAIQSQIILDFTWNRWEVLVVETPWILLPLLGLTMILFWLLYSKSTLLDNLISTGIQNLKYKLCMYDK